MFEYFYVSGTCISCKQKRCGNKGLDKLSGTYKYGRYATNLGCGLSVGVAVYRITQGYEQDGGQIGYHTAKAASSSGFGLGFSIYGATHGATIGAGVGSWFGGIGAIQVPLSVHF